MYYHLNNKFMNLDNLLKIKLKNELLFEILNYYNDNLSEFISKKEFIIKYNKKIKNKLSENKINIDKSTKIIKNKNNQCCARIMGPRYSDLRCSSSKINNSDYCLRHLNKIYEYGYLSFGRYDQLRPRINEKGNKIPWRDTTPMEDINIIIQYQNMNLLKLIKL